jgi:hypothetical protein
MADFCSQCSPFEGEFDIDLKEIAIDLEPGHSESFLCEGCNNRAVYKDLAGFIYIGKEVEGKIVLNSVAIDFL